MSWGWWETIIRNVWYVVLVEEIREWINSVRIGVLSMFNNLFYLISYSLQAMNLHGQKCKSTIDCATRCSYQASHGPLRDAQSIVAHSRSIDICAWDYGTTYCWQSINLSQSLLPAGFAGTIHTH
jgi:hypothetical protein